MVDVVDAATRSRMMAGIRSKDTKGEIQLRSAMHALGFRYRLHRRDLPGKPDLVFPRYRAVIFVNGCFWHGHSCSLFKWPKSRPELWQDKIHGNKRRDERVYQALRADGWRVAVVWECSWKGRYKLPDAIRIERCCQWLKSSELEMELTEHDPAARTP